MISLVTVLALVLAFIFLVFSKKTYKGNYYLAGFFLTIGFWGFMMQLVAFSDSTFWAPVLFIHSNPLLYLSGPLIYLYVRSIVEKDVVFRTRDWLHFVLPLLIFINLFPYYFLDFQIKKEMILKLRELLSYPDMKEMSLLVPYKYTEILRPIVLFMYSIGSIWYLHRQRKVLYTNKQTLGIPSMHLFKWLKLQMYIISIYSLLYTFLSFSLSNVLPSLAIYDLQPLGAFVKFAILLSMIAFFFVPSILYGLPHEEVYKNFEEVKPSEKLLLYDDKYMTKIGMEVDRVVAQGIFLREDFAIGILAKEIKIAEHHLTYYFNHVVEMKFTDWKNFHRVEYAKKKIASGYLNNASAEQLAKEAGYSHQSTFYAVFKKNTDQTPGEYDRKFHQDKKNSANV